MKISNLVLISIISACGLVGNKSYAQTVKKQTVPIKTAKVEDIQKQKIKKKFAEQRKRDSTVRVSKKFDGNYCPPCGKG